jgi:flagellar hook protein FlgE
MATDMAIEGEGFFITQLNGERLFTRDGSFLTNENNELVSSSGAYVMGYGLNGSGEIQYGELQPITIPLGQSTVAEATQNVYFTGNLNASGDVATTGSIIGTEAFFSDLGGLNAMDGTEDLTLDGNNLYVMNADGVLEVAIEGGAQATIEIDGVQKGGQTLDSMSFTFCTEAEAIAGGIEHYGSTMADFAAFLDDVLGLDNSDQSGQSLGGNVLLNSNGSIIIFGNKGTAQDLEIETGDFKVSYKGETSESTIVNSFMFDETNEADGESVRTSFVVYDSLGTAVTVDVTMVLQDTIEGQGTVWQFIAESSDNHDTDRIVGMGTIVFDDAGNMLSASDTTATVTRTNGAASPMSFELDFTYGAEGLTAYSDSGSSLSVAAQDGSGIGHLVSFSVGVDGLIVGAFTNGLTRQLGQVALARFNNPGGLEDIGGGFYRVGANSGEPMYTTAMDNGTGRIIGGALELSNVDLSQEFIDMILASTGYSASSRVISTTDELMDQLLMMAR